MQTFAHFFAFRTRGVGGLPRRCPPSACGRVILYRPSSLYHNARGYKRRGPARYRINADVAPVECFFLELRGILSRMRFLLGY